VPSPLRKGFRWRCAVSGDFRGKGRGGDEKTQQEAGFGSDFGSGI